MISWLSFTTSKVLPTFVGEASTTASTNYSFSRASGWDFAGRFVGDATETSSQGRTLTPALTKIERQAGATAGLYALPETWVGGGFPGAPYQRTGETPNDIELHVEQTIVNENSTIFNGTRTETSPLATIRQETTKTESYKRQIRTTKTISAYDEEEGAGPLFGYVWTTTQVEKTLANGETTNIPSVTQVTTNTAETVVDFVTTEAQRTIITTTGAPIELTTYTAINGNVEVVAHTIVEAPNAASFDSPQAEIPVTQLSFAPTRFTLSYSEAYTKTLPIRDDSESTKGVTTIETISENHATTTLGYSNESYKGWQLSFETRTCENRTGFTVYTEIDDEGNEQEYTVFDGVDRFIPKSYELNHGFTVESETVVNSTQETFETYFGGNSETFVNPDNYTTGIRLNDGSDQRTLTRYVANSLTEQISTFSISGDFFQFSSQDWPGLVQRNSFPWKYDGDGGRRYFSVVNSETTQIQTDSRIVTFGHTWSISHSETRTEGIAGTSTVNFVAKKIGQFFEKNIYSQIRNNTATVIAFQHSPFADHGLASPQLTFRTQNDHATVGAFMSDNAQHTWEGWPSGFEIERGMISQGVVGAVPLYPTFSGIIRRDSEGWELCDSSEYTTVVGSRVGQNFSTTIAWQTIEGTSTKNSTSSGSFTIQSTTVATVGAAPNFTPTIAGGFATPNASRTVIISPGVVAMTTYDASGSGTLSTNYSTGTISTAAPVGPVPVTISSFIPRVQGYGVFTQSLLDDGLP